MDEAFDEILLPRTNDPAIDFRVVRLGPKVFREPSDARRLPMRSDGPLHNTSDYSSRKHIFRLDPAECRRTAASDPISICLCSWKAAGSALTEERPRREAGAIPAIIRI